MHAPQSTRIIEPELLMLAYRSGIFPMADSRDDPEIFWIEPRLRAIFPLDSFRLSHSLARTLRRGRFEVTCNTAFSAVLEACAAPRSPGPAEGDMDDVFPGDGDENVEGDGSADESGSWISHRIQASYENLHHLGHAHSIECWQRDADGVRRLVGGLYGVGFDRVFCGESMFSTVADGSKVALCWLVAAMRRGGMALLDCQFMTPHLASLGAIEMPQKRYLALLQQAQSTVEGVDSAAGDAGAAKGVAGEGVAGEGDAAGEASLAPAVLALPEAFAALEREASEAGNASSPGKFIAQLLTQTS